MKIETFANIVKVKAMSNFQYGQLGELVFEVFAFRSLKETTKFEYAKHETIYAPSSLQYMQKELREINLDVRFHNQFCDPKQAYEELKRIAEKGEAQKLIIATEVIGDFVVEEIVGEVIQIDSFGKPVIIDVSLKLKEFVKKEMETKKVKGSSKKAPAVKPKPKTEEKSKPKPIITRK